MTCIVGLVGRKGVLIAGDAQGSTDWVKREDTSAKVFQLMDTVAIGYCGSGRFGQILQYHVMEGLEEPPLNMDEHAWVVKAFVPHLRQVVYEHGNLHISHDNNEETFGPSAALMAVRGRLFTVWADFGADEHVLSFEAIGSGAETAMGSMHGELGNMRDPIIDSRLEGIAERAIQAATKLTLHVGGEISYVQTVKHTPDEKALARKILKGA